MYSTLFRELYASRIQLEMNSTETSKLMTASEVRAPSDGDVGHVTTPVAILDPRMESTNCQTYRVSFMQTANGASAMLQIPSGWGPILESFARNGTAPSNPGASPLPLALCLSGYLPQSDASQQQQQQQQLAINSYLGHLASCSSQADPHNFGYCLGGHQTAAYGSVPDPSISQQSTIVSHQSHLPDKSAIHRSSIVEDGIPGCLTCPSEGIATASSSSSSFSSSLSSSLLPSELIFSGGSAVTALVRCCEPEAAVMMQQQQPEDDDDDEEDADADITLSAEAASGLRVSPHQQQQQQPVRREDGVYLPVPTRIHEPLVESSDYYNDDDDDDDDDDDEESRPRSSLGPFDRRRGSLEGGPRGEGPDDPVDTATTVGGGGGGGPSAGSAAPDRHPAPSQMRRSSIACIPLSSSSKGPTRGPPAPPHLLHRHSAAALDYESLKVRLERLTGPVTEGASKAAADRGRRTSLPVPVPPGAVAAHGLSGAAVGGSTLSSVDAHGEDDQTTKGRTTDAVDGASNPPQTKDGGQVTATQRPPSNSPPSHPKDHLETDEKNLMEDLSPSNSLSSSWSSTSSSFLEKLRLQCVIEHVLQNDLRLHEIIKRHELEREYVRRKHRCQWLELEKSLTQNFGEAWKSYADIPELSFVFASSGFNHHAHFADAARQLQHHYQQQQQQLQQQQQQLQLQQQLQQLLQQQQQQQQQNRRGNEGNNAVPGSQNAVDVPLGTIREGQIVEGSSLAENDDELLDNETASFYRTHRLSLAATDRARPTVGLGTTVDERERRRNSEGCLEAPRRKRRSGWHCGVFPRGHNNEDRSNGAEEDEEEETGGETQRLSHNIANCLAKSQCIPCPGSSRLHRREVGPSAAKDTTQPSLLPQKTGYTVDSDRRSQALSQPVQAPQYYPNYYWLTNHNLLLAQLYQQDLVRRLVMANFEAAHQQQQQMPFAAGGGFDPGTLARTGEDFASAAAAGEAHQRGPAVFSADPVGCDQTAWKYSQNPVPEETPASATQVDRRSELQHPHAPVPSFQAPFVGIFPHSLPATSNPAASRIGWATIPEVGLTGFCPIPLLQNERLASFNPQEIGQQILTFPWTTATSRPNPVYSLSSRHDYGDHM